MTGFISFSYLLPVVSISEYIVNLCALTVGARIISNLNQVNIDYINSHENASKIGSASNWLVFMKGQGTSPLRGLGQRPKVLTLSTLLRHHPKVNIELVLVDEVEMDEMWSFVQKKKEQYRLWHAIYHNTGAILAYVFGRRKHVVLKKLLRLLKIYKIRKVYAYGNYAHGLSVWLVIRFAFQKHTKCMEPLLVYALM